jgi:hypothetical protein
MTEIQGEIAKINTILTPALSLKEREKCNESRRAESFKLNRFPPPRE